eukprot:CAMPEP_0117439074 /NCGR_PEP_ID=MMETSP0759-20121206/2381_1 /TAXON_ID=63605 /ORGANISM="Percolomonas cosmopolitus, Strain WS" /LENGTH=686 /DNA_ID=CAMNT_0005230785 /DNA_START=179 /DNA_END=2236 /DNA_ORIENTATION=+
MPTPIFSKNPLPRNLSDNSVSDYLLEHHDASTSMTPVGLLSTADESSDVNRYISPLLPESATLGSSRQASGVAPGGVSSKSVSGPFSNSHHNHHHHRTKSESSSLNHEDDDAEDLYASLDGGLSGLGGILPRLRRFFGGTGKVSRGGKHLAVDDHYYAITDTTSPAKSKLKLLCQGLMCVCMLIFMIAFCVAALVFWIQYATKDRNKSSFLWFSDIHMEPYYNDTASCFQMCRNQLTAWNTTPCGNYREFRDVPKEYGRYGCNTPRELLRATLLEMKAKTGTKYGMNFGIYTGDIAAHGISEVVKDMNDRRTILTGFNGQNSEEEHVAPMTNGHYDESLGLRSMSLHQSLFPSITFINATEVVRETLETVVNDIHEVFHDLPIFLAIGNCDVVHDYQWTTDRKWIMELHKLFKKLWNGWEYVDDSDFVTSRTGNYVVTQLPGLPNMRLISFNALVFSPLNHQNAEITALANWSLSWIEKQLMEAEEEKQTVLLVYHIPVGMNAFSDTPQWIEDYENRFLTMTQRYKNTVESHLCGHFHYESFKLLTDEETKDPFAVLLVSPSVSPFFFSNPSFREFVIDSDHIVDYYNYFFDLEQQDSGVHYTRQHQFQQAYQLPDLSLSSMYALYETLWIKKDFYTLAQYSFRRRSQFMPKTPEYMCSMTHQKKEDMHECVHKKNVGVVPGVRMW